MRLYIITKRNLISIGFCLLIGVLAGAIAVTSTVRAVQSAAAQREIPIYYVDTDKKQVALSFDAAWGNEQTEHLLEILDKYKVKSTFFLVGDWVKNYPDSVKDIAKHGHDVGNHSNTHPHMTQMSSSDMVGQIQSCNEKIKELTGKTPTLFRAPYGDYNNDVVKSVNGCNILMHNGAKNTPEALPTVIEAIKSEGYEIVPISQILLKGEYYTDVDGKMCSKTATQPSS